MKKQEELICPTCDCEIPITGDEAVGENIFCPYCECPLLLKKNKKEDTLYLEEDF